MQQLTGEVEQEDGDDRREVEAAHRREEPSNRHQDRVGGPDDQPDQRMSVIDRGHPRQQNPDHDQQREKLDRSVHETDEIHENYCNIRSGDEAAMAPILAMRSQ